MAPTVEITRKPAGKIPALYMRLRAGRVERTEILDDQDDPGVVADFDAKGHLLGVEFLSEAQLAKFCNGVAAALPRSIQADFKEACAV